MASKTKHNIGIKDTSAINGSIFHMASALSSASSNSLFTYSSNGGFTPSTPNGAPHFHTAKRRIPSRKSDHGTIIQEWLEAMKDSSPPRSRCVQSDIYDKSDIQSLDMEYRAWMSQHPSAIENFDKVLESAIGKPVFVFLDYDGTLSPIVEDPERAFMSDEMRAVVKEIAALFPTAIITGRSREKVYEFVGLPELYYAGSHGMDIMGPAVGCKGSNGHATMTLNEENRGMTSFQPASEFTVVMNEIYKLLEERACKVPGAKVEHNKFCVSVHFRCVKEENWMMLAEHVNEVLKPYKHRIFLTQGRKVLEVRPKISWNKGKALDYLLNKLDFGNRNDVFPIYIGDDKTDEDAFASVVKKKHGLAILVSNVVKDTYARYSLRDPNEVHEFLHHLVKWKCNQNRLSRLY